MKYKLFYILLIALAWVGCNDEDALTPTLESEPVIQFPQGDHDYDARIGDWYTRCGFYILYKYRLEIEILMIRNILRFYFLHGYSDWFDTEELLSSGTYQSDHC